MPREGPWPNSYQLRAVGCQQGRTGTGFGLEAGSKTCSRRPTTQYPQDQRMGGYVSAGDGLDARGAWLPYPSPQGEVPTKEAEGVKCRTG